MTKKVKAVLSFHAMIGKEKETSQGINNIKNNSNNNVQYMSVGQIYRAGIRKTFCNNRMIILKVGMT
jgi:hypothetical protein